MPRLGLGLGLNLPKPLWLESVFYLKNADGDLITVDGYLIRII